MPVIKANFEEKCEFCRKREATKKCDKVTGVSHFAGHPPKGTNLPMELIHHCDKLICDHCAVSITGADFCPKCIREIKEVLGK